MKRYSVGEAKAAAHGIAQYSDLSITREMQSINGASNIVLESSFERIAFKTFES